MSVPTKTPLLDRVNVPEDLRKLLPCRKPWTDYVLLSIHALVPR